MIINPPIGSPCIQSGPMTFTVDGCDSPENIVWTFEHEGLSDPIITNISGNKFSISADQAGAYIIKAECCG